MLFEWDDAKSRANYAKHGLAFEDVERVFAGPTVTFVDDRLNYGETRLVTVGQLAGRIVLVVHTPRGGVTRVISFRKANQREQRIYQERLSQG